MQSSGIRSWPKCAIGLLAAATIVGWGWALAADDVREQKAALGEALESALALPNSRVKDKLLMDVGCELARARQFDEAHRAADAIQFEYWPPSVRIVIAEEQAKAGDATSALGTADQIDAPQQPDLHDEAIKRIALALAKAGDPKRALNVIRLCRRPLMSALAIDAFMSARTEAGDLAGALSAASDFDALRLDPAYEGRALANVARILATRGDVDAAERLAADHKEADSRIFAAIAKARADAGDLTRGARFARRVLEAGADWEAEAQCRVVAIRDLAARGQIDEAKRVADEPWKKPVIDRHMIYMLPSLDSYESQAARAIAGACAERGDIEGARAALSRLPVHRRVLGLVNLVEEREKAGDRATAERLLTAAEDSAESGGLGFYYQDLGAAQFRFGRRAASRASFEKAMHARDIGTPVNQRPIVATQARAGDLDGAIQTLGMINDPGLRDQARAWVAAVLASQNRGDDAIEVTQPIVDGTARATAMAQVGWILRDKGDPGRAVSLCRRAAEVAGTGDLPPEAARIMAHAWASTSEGFSEAQAWARHLANQEARASAFLGVAQGRLNRPIWIPPDSPYLVPIPPDRSERPRAN